MPRVLPRQGRCVPVVDLSASSTKNLASTRGKRVELDGIGATSPPTGRHEPMVRHADPLLLGPGLGRHRQDLHALLRRLPVRSDAHLRHLLGGVDAVDVPRLLAEGLTRPWSPAWVSKKSWAS